MKKIVLTIIGLLVLYLLYQIGLFIYRVSISKQLVKKSHAVSNVGSGARMLIVGDSTAVGVGATSASTTIAGLFVRDFPNLSVENRAVSGAVLAEILLQLQDAREKYDLILIQGGPNDVLSYRNLKDSKKDSEALLRLARQKSDHVVMLSAGNAGLVPLIPWPISLTISSRTRILRAFLIEQTSTVGVAYIDLYQERKDDEFAKDPKRFYAPDGLHPADAGYAFWYSKIREILTSRFPNLVL